MSAADPRDPVLEPDDAFERPERPGVPVPPASDSPSGYFQRPTGRFARFLSRHPLWCLAAALLLTIASAIAVRDRLRIETDLLRMLPRDSQVALDAQQAVRDFGGFDFMFVVLEASEPGREEELIAAAGTVAEAIYDPKYFRNVSYRIDPELLDLGGREGRARLVARMTESEWNEFERSLNPASILRDLQSMASLLSSPVDAGLRQQVLADPLNLSNLLRQRLEVLRGPIRDKLNRGHYLSSDGQMLLILLWPVRSSTDLLSSNELNLFLQESRAALFERHPEWRGSIDMNFYGAPVEAVLEADQLREDARTTSLLATLLIVVLFAAIFRRPEALIITIVPALLSVIWTMGFIAVTIERLTQVTAMFAAIMMGLGVDFAVHVYNRFLEEVRLGRNTNEAVATAIERTSAGNVASTTTTALAFFSITATSFVGFRELGLVLGTGIIMCLLASLLTLPALLRALGPFELRLINRRPLPAFGLRRARFLATAYPRLTVLASLTLVCFLAIHARNVEFDTDFTNLREVNRAYRDLRDRIERKFTMPADQVIVVLEAPTLDEALRENDRLYRNLVAARASYPWLGIDSVRTFYPSPETQRQSLERMAGLNVTAIAEAFERNASALGLAPRAYTPVLEELRELSSVARGSVDAGAPVIDLATTLSPGFEQIVQRHVYHASNGNYRVMTQVYPEKGLFDRGIPPGFMADISVGLANPPSITGVARVWSELEHIVARDLALIALLTFFSLGAFMLLYFRHPGRALLATMPVVAGMLITLGVADIMGMKLNYLNIIAFPIIVGIGVDAAFHLLHRYHELGSFDLRIPIERTGRAIVVSSLATCFGFAALTTAGFATIRDIGTLILIGVFGTMTASVVLLPAMLRLLEERAFAAGGPGDELG